MKVLFVCMGNICRSPTAQGVFRKLVAEEAAHLDLEIDSAGTHAYHTGEPPDRRAQAVARERGVELSDIRARKVRVGDFEYFDYILAMDQDNLELLKEWCPEEHRHRLGLLMEFADRDSPDDVPDPYYGSVNGFEYVLDLVEEASRGLLREIIRFPRET